MNTPLTELSPKMQAARDHLKKHGDKLVRYPGGYWAAEDWHMWKGPCFGTSTVEALVRRGVAKYTDWKIGKKSSFPIEATLCDGVKK